MTPRSTRAQHGYPCNVASWRRGTPLHDQSPPRPRSPPRALALDGSLRAPAARLDGEHRSGVRGAARRLDRRLDARPGGRGKRAHLGRLSPLVGPGGRSHEARAAGTVARAAALRRPLCPVSLVAAARGAARPAGAHPRSQLRAHGDAGAAPSGDRHRARPDARHHPALAHRRLARRGAQPFPARHAQGAAARARLHRGHRVAQARARDLADWRIPDNAFVVLHVGSTVERKNVPLVINTVARLRAEADAYLLQVGGRFSNEQQQLIERLGLKRFVRTAPLADESTLRRAYRAADVLLFPSLYEGFGYPVIEAFASGLPVVTSGAGGLKEVGGDAVVVVEGRDPAAYVEALESLSDDPLRREELVESGRARARTFTWQRTAEQTADVYRSLL